MTYFAPDKIPYDEWFDPDYKYNPLDSMPIATDKEWDENPRPEEEIADDITMHEKMYRIATARNNPFHVGGSENAQSDVDYIKKHSPWPGGSEEWQDSKPG